MKYRALESKTKWKADNGGDYREFEGSERSARGQISVAPAGLDATIELRLYGCVLYWHGGIRIRMWRVGFAQRNQAYVRFRGYV